MINLISARVISEYKFKVTVRVYSVRSSLSCNSSNVLYIISCKSCEDQYVGSATKARFRICKADIKTRKDRFCTARHFSNKWCDSSTPHIFVQARFIEFVQSDVNPESKSWERKTYWQCQLFTNTRSVNSVSDLYLRKGKGFRKN